MACPPEILKHWSALVMFSVIFSRYFYILKLNDNVSLWLPKTKNRLILKLSLPIVNASVVFLHFLQKSEEILFHGKVTVKMTMKQRMLVHKLVTIADNKCSSEGMLLAGYMKFLSVKSDHCFIYLFIISWKVADPRMARWPPGWKPGPGATWPGKRSLSLDQLVISPNISGWSFK